MHARAGSAARILTGGANESEESVSGLEGS